MFNIGNGMQKYFVSESGNVYSSEEDAENERRYYIFLKKTGDDEGHIMLKTNNIDEAKGIFFKIKDERRMEIEELGLRNW